MLKRMAFYLGIDGGGTRTSCVVGDETAILGRGSGAGSNVVRVGEAQARESFFAAVGQACASAAIKPAQISRTCIGLSGGARPQIGGPVRRMLSEVLSGEIEIVGDMVIALRAAFDGAPGVIAIAGTGSIAYGANGKAQARAGGWGFAISDEGSGHWIGRTAVAAVVRAQDENEDAGASSLLSGILRAWNLPGREQLVVAANSSPDFANLFPVILRCADSGDTLALDILAQAGRELAGLARIVIGRLFSHADTVPVAMTGGVFANSSLVREVFYNTLSAQCLNAVVQSGVVEPVHGALALARKL